MRKSPGHLLIRADGNADIGVGHVMRTLAIAQAWIDLGGTVSLVTKCLPDPIERQFAGLSVEIITVDATPGSANDADLTARYAEESDRVIVDGYVFREPFQDRVRRSARRLLVVDDFCQIGEYCSDIILDSNFGTDRDLYARKPGDCLLLLGPKFVPLRREFASIENRERDFSGQTLNVVVTFGGSVARSLMREVLRVLASIGRINISVRAFLAPQLIQSLELGMEIPETWRVEPFAIDMSTVMDWADVAISGAGTTCWELAYRRVPMGLIVLAENQEDVAQTLNRQGVATLLGSLKSLSSRDLELAISEFLADPHELREQSRKAASLVDSRGASRVAEVLAGPVNRGLSSPLALRLARPEDSRMLWRWVNDPVNRASAFDSRQIPWESHQKWFESRLDDESCTIFVAVSELGFDIGQIRFESTTRTTAEVDVSVSSEYRGLGLGGLLIQNGCLAFVQSHGVRTVHAYVKPENEPSKRSFLKAGFRLTGEVERKKHRALHLEWEASQ